MLTDLFKNIYCINLDSRTDKWEQAQTEFKTHNIDGVKRFSAIKGNPDNLPTKLLPGEVGCLLSHLQIIKEAKEKNLDNIVVFEDDIIFHKEFNSLFNEFIKQVPADWNMIYFAGNHQGPTQKIMPNIMRLSYTFTTHAYIMKNTMFDRVISEIPKLERQVDVYYALFHRFYPTYCFLPHLIFQRPGISDIHNVYSDYSFLHK